MQTKLSPTDQETTLQNAMGGDINAFQQLYAGFHRQLKGYLYRLLTDREDVEDIAHDTFIKAFERIGQYKGESSFRTWVFSIATNLAYDVLKRRKRWQPVSGVLASVGKSLAA